MEHRPHQFSSGGFVHLYTDFLFLFHSGNITSGLLFLSPVPTFLDIRSHESTEQYSANAYLAALLNCAIWVLYGLVQPQGALLVVSINTIGVLMEFFYVACFLYYSADELRHKVVWMLVGAMLFVAVIFTLVFSLADTPEHKSMGFGLVGIATGIGMYAAPVINLVRVYVCVYCLVVIQRVSDFVHDY